MATLDQLSTALRNADAAGDADAARVLAAEITKMRGAGSVQPDPQRGAWDKLTGATGPRHQLWPERMARGVVDSVVSGATLPGDVVSGRVQMTDESGRTNPSVIPRVLDTAMMGMPINPAVRAGDRAIPGVSKALETPKAPTAEALEGAATEGFKASKGMGVELPTSVRQMVGDHLEQQLQGKGIHAEHAPIAYAQIKRLKEPSAGPVTISDIHNIRQAFGNAGGNINFPKDTLAGSLGVSTIDKVLQVVEKSGGTPAEAARALKDAIGNSAAAFRSDRVTGRADMAELRAKVANSGQNVDNAIRQRFVDIASEGKAARGFNDPEIAQAVRIAEGGPVTNAARFAGNALGGGGGLGLAITSGLGAAGGAMVGGPVGAGVGATVGPAVGAASKAVANAMTRREAAKLDEMVRQRSPLFDSIQANPGTIKGSRPGLEAIARLISEGAAGSQNANDPRGLIARLMQQGGP